MNIQQLFEGVGALAGLPKHWIKYLANRWGKGYNYGDKLAGENSAIAPIKGGFDPGKIKKALKDPTNIGVIGRVDGEPLFMIAVHDSKTSKYRFFEVQKGEGYHDSKGVQTYRGRRSRSRSSVADSYNMNEVIDIADKLGQNLDLSRLTVDAITKDPKREELVKKRREYVNTPDDPLYRPPTGRTWGDPSATPAQKKVAKKYAELKRPKLDARIDTEVNKIKDQMGTVLDKALENMIKNVKQGNTYSVNKKTLAEDIARAIDTVGIERLAAAYSAIKTEYSDKTPLQISKELKRTGLA